MAFGVSASYVATQNGTVVPPEYAELYSVLETSLNNYDAYLASLNSEVTYPVVYGAELLPANSNRGESLLAPQTMNAVELFLDRFQQLGIQGVTVPVSYPLYTPHFPRYEEYVQFFKQVAQKVREHGMTLALESSIIFGNTPFSTLQISYDGLTFEKFKSERRYMVQAIIQDLQPDYLNLGAEPDTQYQLTGLEEFNSPQKYVEYVNYVLDGLDRGATKIGAGIGTWGKTDYVTLLATETSLDSIHVHVYPVTGDYMTKILTIADIAHKYGKSVVMDEAWLYKIANPTASSVPTSPEIFGRDIFSFWAPLDQKFLSLMAKSAQIANIEYISPFWTTFFFAYVEYTPEIADLSYQEASSLVNQIAAANILSGTYTSTGLHYGQLIGMISSTTIQVETSTTSPQDSAVADEGFSRLVLVAVMAALSASIVTLLLVRRKEHSTKRAKMPHSTFSPIRAISTPQPPSSSL